MAVSKLLSWFYVELGQWHQQTSETRDPFWELWGDICRVLHKQFQNFSVGSVLNWDSDTNRLLKLGVHSNSFWETFVEFCISLGDLCRRGRQVWSWFLARSKSRGVIEHRLPMYLSTYCALSSAWVDIYTNGLEMNSRNKEVQTLFFFMCMCASMCILLCLCLHVASMCPCMLKGAEGNLRYHFFLVSVRVCGVYMWRSSCVEVGGYTVEIVSVHPPCGVWRWDSGQAWWQVPLPSEPSR